MKILIWGTGNTAKQVLENGVNGELVGFVRSKVSAEGELSPYRAHVYTPEVIDISYDMIFVASIYSDEIYKTICEAGIPLKKVCFMYLPDVEEINAEENFKKCKSFLSISNQAHIQQMKREKSSITDNGVYPSFCLMAANEDELFKNFRNDTLYTKVLEHITFRLGQRYLDVIMKEDRPQFTKADWEDFCKNDLYGNPQLFRYDINGNSTIISSNTLRYIKVLSDIVDLFDVKKLNTIAEIGIGYAGQCRLMMNYIRTIEKYALFDLPEVLQLAKRYLESYGSTAKVEFIDGTKPYHTDARYDLVISNYAFSELTRSAQDAYLDNIILKSDAGYITWNSLSFEELDGYSVDELIGKIPGSSIMPEEPGGIKNCIIIWGQRMPPFSA